MVKIKLKTRRFDYIERFSLVLYSLGPSQTRSNNSVGAVFPIMKIHFYHNCLNVFPSDSYSSLDDKFNSMNWMEGNHLGFLPGRIESLGANCAQLRVKKERKKTRKFKKKNKERREQSKTITDRTKKKENKRRRLKTGAHGGQGPIHASHQKHETNFKFLSFRTKEKIISFFLFSRYWAHLSFRNWSLWR